MLVFYINSILWFFFLFYGVSDLCITIKSLSRNQRFSSRYLAIEKFSCSYIKTWLFLTLYHTSILHTVYSCVLSSLPLRGWKMADLKPVSYFFFLFY